MASSYPGGYDVLPNPSANLSGPPLHSTIENSQKDAIEAIQAELGLTPSGADATVAATLAALPSRYVSTTRKGGSWTRVANQSIPNSVATAITWDTEGVDTDGFLALPNTNFVVPAGLGGMYAISAMSLGAVAALGQNFLRIAAGGLSYDFSGNTVGQRQAASVVVPLVATDIVTVSVFHVNGAAVNFTGAMHAYRIGG